MSKGGKRPENGPFYRPGSAEPGRAPGTDVPQTAPARPSSGLGAIIYDPVILPVTAVVLCLVVLGIAGRLVQGSRLSAAQRDFGLLMQQQCRLIAGADGRTDFGDWARQLDGIGRRGAKSSSGIFGLFLSEGRALQEKSTAISAALNSLKGSKPSTARHAALSRLLATVEREGTTPQCVEPLKLMIQRDLSDW